MKSTRYVIASIAIGYGLMAPLHPKSFLGKVGKVAKKAGKKTGTFLKRQFWDPEQQPQKTELEQVQERAAVIRADVSHQFEKMMETVQKLDQQKQEAVAAAVQEICEKAQQQS